MRRRTYHYIAFTAFALILLIACWETNRASAAFIEGGIPKESIRIRILANSDTISDQWIKRQVRDAVIEEMNRWVTGPQNIETARAAVREHLPELRQVVGKVLREHHYNYGYDAELEEAPFPTKMYGDRVYPAGNYEALLVTLGGGGGQNWWCVLFPPLCFVDAVTGEAAQKDSPDSKADAGKDKHAQTQNSKSEKSGQDAGLKVAKASAQGQDSMQVPSEKQIHFFIWDMLVKLVDSVKTALA